MSELSEGSPFGRLSSFQNVTIPTGSRCIEKGPSNHRGVRFVAATSVGCFQMNLPFWSM